MEHDIHNMDMLQNLKLNDWSSITRVPGGWVYIASDTDGISSTFIPYSDEFRN